MKKKLALHGSLWKMQNMDYKRTLKEYKKYQAERTKRCGVLFKALEYIPEPTAEQMQGAYERLSQRNAGFCKQPQAVINLECLVEYLQEAIEPNKKPE
jgi:hypothetical protein